jgi:hypothetical protein
MEAKFFSYKVQVILLDTVNENLKLSKSFNKKELLNELKEFLKDQNFKIDPATVEYKIHENEVSITGMAVEDERPKSIGFMAGK